VEGPFDPNEVEQMLEEDEINPFNYGYTFGMKEWRSVKEALVWARRDLAARLRISMTQQTRLLCEGKTNTAAARVALAQAGRASGTFAGDYDLLALEVIIETNLQVQREHEKFAQNFEPGAIDVFPAWELFQCHEPDFPRDWHAAWTTAGGRLTKGRMIAAKADPIWRKLSDFDLPFVPFSFDRGYYIRDIMFSECGLAAQPAPLLPPLKQVF
jgi:hypothetical protein